MTDEKICLFVMLKICIYISISSSFHLNHVQNYEANTLSNLWLNGIANCSEKPVAYSSLTFIIISENFYFIFRVPDPNCSDDHENKQITVQIITRLKQCPYRSDTGNQDVYKNDDMPGSKAYVHREIKSQHNCCYQK